MRKSGIYRVRHKDFSSDTGAYDWQFAQWNTSLQVGIGGFWEYFGGEDWFYDDDLAEIDENPIALSPEQPKPTEHPDLVVKAKYLTALRALIAEYDAGDGYWTGHEDEDAILAVRRRNHRSTKELLSELREYVNARKKPKVDEVTHQIT